MTQAPKDLLPHDGITVTSPPAFSWTPGSGTRGIYLNVSTDPTFAKIDVLNWKDDGDHYQRGSIDFQNLKGTTIYWRIVYDSVPTPVRSLTVGENSIDPYYIIIHIQWPGGSWDPQDLSSIDDSLLTDIKSRIGSLGKTPDKKIGFSFHIPYFFDHDIAHYKLLTDKLCQIAQQTEIPILFGLDGFAWWKGRPDLWNWWDSTLPGYNPDNVDNVEWASWASKDAVRFGWRNWGTPFKLQEPHPNILSRKFIAANKDALKELVPIIRDWYQKLPSDKQYLFAGIKLGWETGIGSQYYYPKDESDSNAVDHPDKGYQVGFAAVKTAGLANSGELSQSDLTKCVQMHFSELAETVFQEGIPRRKIYTHAGAFDDSVRAIKYITTDAALTPFANPGWSFYSGDMGPQGLGGIDSTLNKVDSIWWANSEWGGGGSDWEKTLLKFETYRNNKIINSFAGYDSNAFRKLVDLPPRIDTRFHWLSPPIIRSEVQGNTAILYWDSPSQAQELYLNVTTQPDFTDSGLFKSVNVANEKVTLSNTKVLNDLSSGKYYWVVVADGYGRRVLSDINVFFIR